MPLTDLGIAEYNANGTQNFDYVAVGTSNTAFAQSQTALQGTEVGRVAVGALTVAGTTATIEAAFANSQGNPTPPAKIYEVGIFDASSGGNMWYRKVYSTGQEKTSASAMITSIIESLANA